MAIRLMSYSSNTGSGVGVGNGVAVGWGGMVSATTDIFSFPAASCAPAHPVMQPTITIITPIQASSFFFMSNTHFPQAISYLPPTLSFSHYLVYIISHIVEFIYAYHKFH